MMLSDCMPLRLLFKVVLVLLEGADNFKSSSIKEHILHLVMLLYKNGSEDSQTSKHMCMLQDAYDMYGCVQRFSMRLCIS